MKVSRFKTFETWNDNIIDNSLFASGRAKYHPKVANGTIHYKSGNIEPYYFAEITKRGDKFICKIYKKKKDGSDKRIRNKIKKNLKLAHNYVREFINQRLKRDKKKKNKRVDDNRDIQKIMSMQRPQVQKVPEFIPSEPIETPKNKTIIRRFQ
jgi:hypothetical protein